MKNNKDVRLSMNYSLLHSRYIPATIVAWLLIIGFSVAYIWMSSQKIDLFLAGQDLAGYDQAMWHLSHNQLPYNSFKNIVMWGDHAHFIIALLTPLYLLWPSPHLLTTLQVLAATIAGWPLYLLARRYTRHELFSLTLLYAYLSFVGLQFALDFDFHPLVFMGSALLWAIYGFESNLPVVYWVATVLGLLTREDAPPIFFTLGFYLLLRRRWKTGLGTMALAAIYFLITVYYIMPLWSPDHAALLYVDSDDKRVTSLAHEILFNPITHMQNMVDTTEKRATIHTLAQSFGYLPLVSPFTYITTSSIMYSRFDSREYYRWLIENHSNGNIAALLGIGALFGAYNIARLTNLLARRNVSHICYPILIAVLIVGVHNTAWRHPSAPLKRWAQATFRGDHDPGFKNRLTAWQTGKTYIPADANVVASAGLLPHVSQRRNVHAFPNMPADATWFALSTHVYQWPTTPDITQQAIDVLQADEYTTLVWRDRDIWIFNRPADAPPLPVKFPEP